MSPRPLDWQDRLVTAACVLTLAAWALISLWVR